MIAGIEVVNIVGSFIVNCACLVIRTCSLSVVVVHNFNSDFVVMKFLLIVVSFGDMVDFGLLFFIIKLIINNHTCIYKEFIENSYVKLKF